MKRPLAALSVALPLLAAASAHAAVDRPYAVAMLQGFDKITARTSRFPVRIGESVAFGTLRITLEACFESPPEEAPESAAFLVVDAVDPGRPRTRVFSGWMFASSPSLSALEHPVYDVWVLDCEEPLEAARSRPAAPEGSGPEPPLELPAELLRPNSE